MADDELMVEIGTEEEIEQAKSKFIKFPVGAKRGDVLYQKIQIQMPDWDNPGTSYKFPVIITEEGVNLGKEDKLSTGVGKKGWKLIETLDNLGIEHPTNNVTRNVSFNRTKLAGMNAIGEWTMQVGVNQSTGTEFDMPKLTAILRADFKAPANRKIM